MLIYQLSTYTPELDFADENIFFDILGLPPTAGPANRHARHLLRLVNPDKNPSIPAEVSQLIPGLKEAKNVLTDPRLNKVYQCCGMPGVQYILLNTNTVYTYTLFCYVHNLLLLNFTHTHPGNVQF